MDFEPHIHSGVLESAHTEANTNTKDTQIKYTQRYKETPDTCFTSFLKQHYMKDMKFTITFTLTCRLSLARKFVSIGPKSFENSEINFQLQQHAIVM